MTKPIQCPESLFQRDLSGKTILITGGYGGIGLETAKQLRKQKATVILAGRNAEKGNRVATEIGAQFMQVDFSDMESVKTFAATVNDNCDQIDVLMCNAAIMPAPAHDK